MRAKTLILTLLLVLLAPLGAAHAQRASAATWDLLGEQRVGFRIDNDSIEVNQTEDWFRSRAYRTLRFVAERADVHLVSLRINYINGYAEDLDVERLISRGGQLLVDLKGERSFLKRIDMRYRARLGLQIGEGGIQLQQAVVKVYGERVARRPEAPYGGSWVEIDRQRFDRTDAQVVLGANRGDGRFGQIRLRSSGEPVTVQTVRIRFRSGETQVVRLNQRLGEGEQTGTIDLEGAQRIIESVTVQLEPRRRPGAAELQLVATRRPGEEAAPGPVASDPYVGRGWVLLGQNVVGFNANRDVIEVGQPEEWFRNRSFKALHLVAERNDVHLMTVRVIYLNGHAEDLSIDRLIRAGTDLRVDLRGDRSFIRRLELAYRARPGFRGQAVLKVFGEPAGR